MPENTYAVLKSAAPAVYRATLSMVLLVDREIFSALSAMTTVAVMMTVINKNNTIKTNLSAETGPIAMSCHPSEQPVA